MEIITGMIVLLTYPYVGWAIYYRVAFGTWGFWRDA